MDHSIIPRSMIDAKAEADFERGYGRDGHGFNWHAYSAIEQYQAAWDRCAAKAYGFQLAEVSPP